MKSSAKTLQGYSFQAASFSKKPLKLPSGETVCTANISEFLPFPTADCTTSALPAPHTTTAVYEDVLITGKVKVILFWRVCDVSNPFLIFFEKRMPGEKRSYMPIWTHADKALHQTLGTHSLEISLSQQYEPNV